MKFSDMFDQNPSYAFQHSNENCSHSLTLRAKVMVIAKTKDNAQGCNKAVTPPPPKKKCA